MTVEVDTRWAVTQDDTTFQYYDAGCSMDMSDNSLDASGFFVEHGDGTASAYMTETGSGEGLYFGFDYSFGAGGAVTLVPTVCLPGDCASSAGSLTLMAR